LKDRHPGADIWIIASGPSAGLVEPRFFDGKITIGVNRVWTRFKTDYLVIKETAVLSQAIETGSTVIASRHNCGTLAYPENKEKGDYYYFDHDDNGLEEVNLDVIGTDKIVVSFSTITSAMNLAAYMGAKNIILVGHDCGSLNGMVNFAEYPENLLRDPKFYSDFLARIEPQSKEVRARLEQVYGCLIYSLNPYLNFGLEGNCYESSRN